METKDNFQQKREWPVMAHKLETPQPMLLAIRDTAEAVGKHDTDEIKQPPLEARLADFKQNVLSFMNHFNLEIMDFQSDMEDKRFARGGFKKRAVQEHAFKGVNELRLVRDKLSTQFLGSENRDLYLVLLNRKLEEEARELTEATSRHERREELGDVFEVFNTILEVNGISESLVESTRQMKEIEQRRKQRTVKRKNLIAK